VACSGSTPPRTCWRPSSTASPPSCFLTATDIDWTVAALIAVDSTPGGLLGAGLGRGLPPATPRTVILTIGVTAAVPVMVR
jgi:hypothetical protein